MTPESTGTGFSRTSERADPAWKKGDKGVSVPCVYGSRRNFMKSVASMNRVKSIAVRLIRAILCERIALNSVNASMTLRNDVKEENHEFRGHTRRSFLN